MINRAIVDNETGVILGTGICQECDFNLVPEGTTAYVNTGDWRDDTHKLVDVHDIRGGAYDLVIVAPPCNTFSRAHFRSGPGPKPLRDREHPEGFPNLDAT